MGAWLIKSMMVGYGHLEPVYLNTSKNLLQTRAGTAGYEPAVDWKLLLNWCVTVEVLS